MKLLALAVSTFLLAACSSARSVSAPTTTAAPPGTTAPVTTPAAPAGPTQPSAAHPCLGAPPPATYQHVVWIVMENRALDEVAGSGEAPFLANLATRCGLATNYSGVAHPSLPNYIALTSGSTQGISDDAGPSSHRIAGPSLFSLLGPGWRSLEESMPTNCDRSSAGEYATRHNPAVYYTALATACGGQDVPLGSVPDVSARFTFITPNLCDDMHDCSTATGDRWLSGEVPKILDSPQYRGGATALFITWDENDAGGSLVPTYVVAPSVRPGTRSGGAYDHYSLLRTTEEMLGLTPLLGSAASAPDMRRGFHL
ncbi:MAG: alkaline phosphatase family protein [Acidimicrobiales bacterium]